MKRRIIIRGCIAILIIAVLSYWYFPLKFAVPKDRINIDSEYIIVKQYKASDIQWQIIPDENCEYSNQHENCEYSNQLFARLSGNIPRGYNANVEMDDNEFICYGELVEYENGGIIEFNVTSWDIVYPIKYGWAVFPCLHPSAYLSRLDYNPK